MKMLLCFVFLFLFVVVVVVVVIIIIIVVVVAVVDVSAAAAVIVGTVAASDKGGEGAGGVEYFVDVLGPAVDQNVFGVSEDGPCLSDGGAYLGFTHAPKPPVDVGVDVFVYVVTIVGCVLFFGILFVGFCGLCVAHFL